MPASTRILLDASGDLYHFHDLVQAGSDSQSSEDTFTYLTSTLSSRVLGLPMTGSFRNTWFIKHDRTSQPLDRLFIPNKSAAGFKQITISGYPSIDPNSEPHAFALPLAKPVDDFTTLPSGLDELFGLVLETRVNNKGGGKPKNAELVDAVKSIVLEHGE
jgi:hypothetical protein